MRHYLSVLALCTLFFAGCLPESKNPLSSPSASLIDPKLEGTFAQRGEKKDDPGYWHFHFRGTRNASGTVVRPTPRLEILGVEALARGELRTTRYEALATRIGGHNYLSFYGLPENGAKRGSSLPYSFARYEVNLLGEVRIWVADHNAFTEAVKAGKIRGSVVKNRYGAKVKITDTTEHLAAFIAAGDPKVLFADKPLVLRRIGR